MAKGKGGTGRGTDRKGWTRWDKSAKAKNATKVFGKGKGKTTDAKGTSSTDGAKEKN
ncbi:DUF3934 family protein [Paenibacillus nasutitermitis]|uniref:DUF3934 domain-containing protein n=1 Tax=Paenibacillus nasutitermitis TaxID=1652958 RepID=A0A917DZZ6_9BACL|nr:DUF3934 family protein [Paenibacillus nasutitermitis]GGD89120.1 hypothetical protein GCM10010911_54650 [Paenibacillus nasutitermitis]